MIGPGAPQKRLEIQADKGFAEFRRQTISLVPIEALFHYYPDMRPLSSTFLASILVMGIAACATADGDEKIVGPVVDGGLFVPPDATIKTVDAALTDASDIQDATIVPPVDAAILVSDAEIGGIFCDENEECASQDCCALGVCLGGTRIGSGCLPNL